MKVFTYFEQIRGLHYDGDLLHLWSVSWQKYGWTPVVLGRSDATSHRLFSRFSSATHLLRTVNPAAYELACYIRWLAVSLAGGGVMTDWDVMNYGYTPDRVAPTDRIKLLSMHSPCVAIGTTEAFEKVIQYFLDFEANPHRSGRCEQSVSDQNVLLSRPEDYDLDNICKEVFEDHWATAPLVHFPTTQMAKLRQRFSAIQALRAP